MQTNHINKKSLGLALGIVWGLLVFIGTLWVSALQGGHHLFYLKQFYPGYEISFWGAVVGLFWGFISGYIIGWSFAWFYNIFEKK